jgi:predicted aldo/keto reductase-like oxidoreductase
MSQRKPMTDASREPISRRRFVQTGGAALAGSAALAGGAFPLPTAADRGSSVGASLYRGPFDRTAQVKAWKTLGRTGFEASDVGMGSVPLRDAAVVRYAFDKGVNYFDTAEGYGNGTAERVIGEALKDVDRQKFFLTTKIGVSGRDTEETIRNRFRSCQERLGLDMIDAFYMHGPSSVEALGNPAFHTVCDQLKSEGRLRFVGLSYHGPRGPQGTSMADLCCAAAEDGRFDLMLFVYSFMNREEGDRILAACRERNVGTTAMKTSPGTFRYDPVDPENLTEEQQRNVERLTSRGRSREQAIQSLRQQADRQREGYEQTRPFIERYGVSSEEELRLASIHWVMQNPLMQSACVSFTDFDLVDKVVPLSGEPMGTEGRALVDGYGRLLDDQYCRHGCNACSAACPAGVPVSTIMRYAYYFESQGLERMAMQKYAALTEPDVRACFGCEAPCNEACPYGLNVQSQLVHAHARLTLE